MAGETGLHQDTRRAWLRREGEYWTFEHDGTVTHVRDGKGLRYLSVLFEHPELEIHARELVTAGDTGRLVAASASPSDAAASAEAGLHADADGAGPALDEAAKRAYRDRLQELEGDVEEAESFNDPERAARAREELAFLQRELAAAVGLGGRDRPSGSAAERARVNVTRAIRSTLKRIADGDPVLGRYLDISVKTGLFCAFRPPPQFTVGLGEPVLDHAAPPEAPEAGEAAPAAAPPPRAVGRALRTFVHLELPNALELAARLGDDRWRDLLEQHDEAVHAHAGRAGGHAGERMGERTMDVFDVPGAALDFAEAIAVRGRAEGHPLRVGVHTGESEMLGETYVGIAVHATARVASLAEPGEVVVSGIVHDLVAGTDRPLEGRGVHELRGVAGEWRLYALATPALAEPLSASEAGVDPTTVAIPAPARLTAAAEQPLFGRSTELDRLGAALARAGSGQRSFVAIAGEPGIGKTRLCAELGVTAHAAGATVLYGRCDDGLGVPYQPFVEALGHLVEHLPPAIAGRLGGRSLGRLIPQLAARGATRAGPDDATGAPDARADGDRYVLYTEVAALLSATPRPPLVLILDDLHWVDRPTLQLLRYVLRGPAPQSLLVIVTYRPTDVADDHPLVELLGELTAEDTAERLDLEGLSPADIVALTARVVGHDLPPGLLGLARQLSAETRGNAFFLTEILRHLAESGDLVHITEGEHGADAGPIELPGNVRETIGRRVARLGPEGEELLATAAAIGADFDSGLLARAAGREEDDVLDLLDAAIAAGLVTAPAGSGRRYRFTHALVVHALYGRLAPGRRRRIHHGVAEALEALCGDDPGARIGELAHHAIRGAYSGDERKAVRYAREAGDRALAQLAPQEGERWYRTALELLEHDAASDEQIRLELLIGLGRAQCQGGNPGFRETLLQASELARRTHAPEHLVEAVLANTRGFVSATGEVDLPRTEMLEAALAAVGEHDSVARARLLATLAAELTFSGDWERRRTLSDEALAVALRLDEPPTLGAVYSARFMTIWTPETLPIRRSETEEALALALLDGDPLARFRALHWRAVTAVECGELDEAAQLVEREAALAEELRQPLAVWLAVYDQATQALMRGLLDEAVSRADEAGRVATESGQPEAMAFYVGQLLNIRFEQGTLGELEGMVAAQVEANPGIPAFRAGLALARCEGGWIDGAREVLQAEAADGFAGFPYDSNWLVGLTIYAEVCGRAGGPDAAAGLHALLAPYAEQVAFNSATTWGSVQRHLGNLAAVMGRPDEAQQRLRDAADRHEAMGAPLWLARTRLDLARLLAADADGDPGDWRPLAEQAMGTARELGASTVETRAAALLDGVR